MSELLKELKTLRDEIQELNERLDRFEEGMLKPRFSPTMPDKDEHVE